MEALFGRSRAENRTSPDAVEFALDLTPEAITLHERSGPGDWKKFASAQLDDPEFPMVIGLLRSEAEAQIGGRRPIRLWLPGEQVLLRRTRIAEGNPAARRRAAFDYIERQTVYRPEDVAIAVAPANGNGETALLITFAATWREARDYAARWGFIPGPVSTRCQAGEFGPEGPVFQLNSEPPERTALPSTRPRRNRLAVAALALAAIAAGAAVWSLRPWETPPAPPGTALEVAVAPAPELPQAAPLPTPEPETRPESRVEFRVESRVDAPPPEHFPDTPVLPPPGGAGHRPAIGTAPQALSPPAVPAALTAPVPLAAAPQPPPDPEPAPPERDPVAAWTGLVPVLEPPGLSSPPGVRAISGRMDPPAWVDSVSRLAGSAAPPLAPAAVEPPPDPKPARLGRAPVAAWTGLAPEAPGLAAGSGAQAFSGGMDPPARVAGISLLAKGASPPPVPMAAPPAEPAAAAGAAPPVPIPLPRPAYTDPYAPTKFASLTSPLPKTRPLRAAGPVLALARTALIGIHSLGTGRKALLRLANGDYRTVAVGDVVEGWRVSMIGTDAMQVSRSGKDRTFALVTR